MRGTLPKVQLLKATTLFRNTIDIIESYHIDQLPLKVLRTHRTVQVKSILNPSGSSGPSNAKDRIVGIARRLYSPARVH
jgi:hypothetical protein